MRDLRRFFLPFSAIAMSGSPSAALAQVQPKPSVSIQAPTEPGAIAIYGKDLTGNVRGEDWALLYGTSPVVRNVSQPTLTPFFPPPGKANGASAIILPGGAFMRLGMDWEGWRVAKALAERGITAFVLKYRLLPTPHDEVAAGTFMSQTLMADLRATGGAGLLKQSRGPDDARQALRIVRDRANEWHLDPNRIGLIGFSAGAMVARSVALATQSTPRPAFLGYFYGPQIAEEVPAYAPPMFDAIALDDPLFPSTGFAIASAWKVAGRPVEIHGYQQGGHGFGLGRPGTTTTLVLDEFIAWLDMQGLLASSEPKP